MHTRTYLKAALHQLYLAKTEMRGTGQQSLSEGISDAELMIVALVRDLNALDQPEHPRSLRL